MNPFFVSLSSFFCNIFAQNFRRIFLLGGVFFLYVKCCKKAVWLTTQVLRTFAPATLVATLAGKWVQTQRSTFFEAKSKKSENKSSVDFYGSLHYK